MTGTRDAEIARLYTEGVTDVKAIAGKVALSERSVCRALIRTECRAPRQVTPAPTLTDRMVAMLEDGASYTDVAETFDVPVKWLRESAPGFGWDGSISGHLAHALRQPHVRKLFHEIRKMPLPRQEGSTP